jgi:hypothetical protein
LQRPAPPAAGALLFGALRPLHPRDLANPDQHRLAVAAAASSGANFIQENDVSGSAFALPIFKFINFFSPDEVNLLRRSHGFD